MLPGSPRKRNNNVKQLILLLQFLHCLNTAIPKSQLQEIFSLLHNRCLPVPFFDFEYGGEGPFPEFLFWKVTDKADGAKGDDDVPCNAVPGAGGGENVVGV